MRFLPLLKLWAAATAGWMLPQVLVVFCLAVTTAEAWKLWHEFTWLGMVGGLWVLAYCYAALMTILNVGSRREVKLWEWLMEAANLLLVVVLASKCPGQYALKFEESVPGNLRIPFCIAAFSLAQLTVTLVARSARKVFQRMQRQSNKVAIVAGQTTPAQPISALTAPSALPPSKKVVSATPPSSDKDDPILVA